jgi:hypothetical protein
MTWKGTLFRNTIRLARPACRAAVRESHYLLGTEELVDLWEN